MYFINIIAIIVICKINFHGPEGRVSQKFLRNPQIKAFVHICNEVWLVKLNVISRGFIKGRAPGKLTGCENDFGHLVWPSRGKFFLERKFISNSFAHLWRPVALLLKTLMKPMNKISSVESNDFDEKIRFIFLYS